jgi:hypothetical protein
MKASIKIILACLVLGVPVISTAQDGQNIITGADGKKYRIIGIEGNDTLKLWIPDPIEIQENTISLQPEEPAEQGGQPALRSVQADDFSYIPATYSVDKTKDAGEIPIIQGTGGIGALTYTIPIEVYPGGNGFQPNMSLVYNSQSGNGVAGMGWNIGGISAITAVDKNVYFDGSASASELDIFSAYILDGMRLIKLSTSDNIINYETEQGNIKVIAYIEGNIIRYFKACYPNGQVAIYGWEHNKSAKKIYPQIRIEDATGKFIEYVYTEHSNIYYISQILYGGQNIGSASIPHFASVKFTYAGREDVTALFSNEMEFKQDSILKEITVCFESNLLKTYGLSHVLKTVS